MRYVVDHDLHIHSGLSACSNDPRQTPERILQYAKEMGYRQICLTDHFWDELVPGASKWYAPQNYAHITNNLPLPQEEGVQFLFGAETEMTKDLLVATSMQRYEQLDFVIIPVSHFHSIKWAISQEDAATEEGRANCFMKKLEALLDMPLPFHKIGLAHLANDTLGAGDTAMYCRVLELIIGEKLKQLFQKAAQLGVGIELNTDCFWFKSQQEQDLVIGFYKLAKDCGCKFYFGSDAHFPSGFEGRKEVAERIVDLLALTEEDKFHIQK